MTIKNPTETYDVDEDRANDEKHHDDPSHDGHFTNEKNAWEADEQVKEYWSGKDSMVMYDKHEEKDRSRQN